MQIGTELSQRIDAATRSASDCNALLARVADADTLLALVASLATRSCAWLEGDLAVELFEEDDGLRVRVLEELGAGLRERVLPTASVSVPLTDVLASAYAMPERLGELRLERVSSRCVLLLAATRDAVVPSSEVLEISQTSLSIAPAPLASSDELDRGWDEAAS
jgi:hypothetical protein